MMLVMMMWWRYKCAFEKGKCKHASPDMQTFVGHNKYRSVNSQNTSVWDERKPLDDVQSLKSNTISVALIQWVRCDIVLKFCILLCHKMEASGVYTIDIMWSVLAVVTILQASVFWTSCSLLLLCLTGLKKGWVTFKGSLYLLFVIFVRYFACSIHYVVCLVSVCLSVCLACTCL